MRRIRDKLPASTLIETLVMMLVAGIVFLAVMEGMTLFSRLVARRTQVLLDTGQQAEGYYRAAALIARADSILAPAPGQLELYTAGRRVQLTLRDSAVVCRTGEFSDTLLTGIGSLRLESGVADTVEIGFGAGFAARFGALSPARRYRETVEETEKEYGYEE